MAHHCLRCQHTMAHHRLTWGQVKDHPIWARPLLTLTRYQHTWANLLPLLPTAENPSHTSLQVSHWVCVNPRLTFVTGFHLETPTLSLPLLADRQGESGGMTSGALHRGSHFPLRSHIHLLMFHPRQDPSTILIGALPPPPLQLGETGTIHHHLGVVDHPALPAEGACVYVKYIYLPKIQQSDWSIAITEHVQCNYRHSY
jgi:hypothetical protein